MSSSFGGLRCGDVAIGPSGDGRHVVAGKRVYGCYRTLRMAAYRRNQVRNSSRPEEGRGGRTAKKEAAPRLVKETVPRHVCGGYVPPVDGSAKLVIRYEGEK